MIEVNGLTRYYGEFAALRNASFTVAKGEIVGLLGLNGAGKSTTLKILAGLIQPSSGSVTIDGVDAVQKPDALRGRIGFLPEDPPMYGDMTVAAFLRHVGKLKGMSAGAIEKRLPEVMAATQITDRQNQVIDTLSHGYRKRVGIAQAVLHDPELVILDEPISGLDPAQIKEMRQVVRTLGEGRAVMISSHILGEISQTCDRILVVHDGMLVAQGTESDLADRGGDDSRIILTVNGDGAAFYDWLEGHAQVSGVVKRPPVGRFPSALVELTGDVREAFLGEVIGAGFGIRLVEAPEDELEHIFLRLTGQEAA